MFCSISGLSPLHDISTPIPPSPLRLGPSEMSAEAANVLWGAEVFPVKKHRLKSLYEVNCLVVQILSHLSHR